VLSESPASEGISWSTGAWASTWIRGSRCRLIDQITRTNKRMTPRTISVIIASASYAQRGWIIAFPAGLG
jgi:hypothetical protein